MPSPLDDLLEPSLGSAGRRAQAPYSSTASFVVSIVGGVASAAIIAFVNSRLLGRDPIERVLAVLLLAAALAFMVYAGHASVMETPPSWLSDKRFSRHINKALGLLVAGLFYRLHKKDRRAIELSGREEPNGWKGGSLMLILGMALNFAAIYIGRSLD